MGRSVIVTFCDRSKVTRFPRIRADARESGTLGRWLTVAAGGAGCLTQCRANANGACVPRTCRREARSLAFAFVFLTTVSNRYAWS
jgi:hypothetical protein